VSNNGSTLPTDIWVPSTYYVQPQRAWQYSLGYFRNFLNNKLETSVEVYYKNMENQIEYKEGYTPSSLHDPERDFVFGRGEAYGAEFFVNKTKGRFTGWVGYTLSWTYKFFDLLNNGDRFPAKYDRRHDISVVASYEQSKKWTVSAVFVYGSGNAITLPTNYYFVDNQLVAQYSKLNAYRIFRITGLTYRLYIRRSTKSHVDGRESWAFSIYNVYSRANPYFLYVDTRKNDKGEYDVKVMQVSIFPVCRVLPTISIFRAVFYELCLVEMQVLADKCHQGGRGWQVLADNW